MPLMRPRGGDHGNPLLAGYIPRPPQNVGLCNDKRSEPGTQGERRPHAASHIDWVAREEAHVAMIGTVERAAFTLTLVRFFLPRNVP